MCLVPFVRDCVLGPPCHRVQSKFFKEVELHIVPLWVCCYIADKKEAPNADKKEGKEEEHGQGPLHNHP